MAAPAALLSSKNQRWQTPDWFLALVRRVGPIMLDPATVRENPTGARHILTPYENALAWTWSVDGLTFCNCPYGRHLSGPVDPANLIIKKDKKTGIEIVEGFGTGWAAKMAQLEGEGLYLVPARVETAWWRTLFSWCDAQLFWSSPKYGARINFVDPDGKPNKNGSTFPSSVFYRGPRLSRFVEVFSEHGTMTPGEGLSEKIFREVA